MNSFEDRSLSVLSLALVATLGWNVLSGTGKTPANRRADAVRRAAPLHVTVLAVADAIAATEGYFAPGDHDGRSLPYRLNNPGSLKRTAIAGADLPTWQDTGLLVFPTKDLGWAALRYQVCTMLTGRSRIYEPSDTLRLVGLKYADGDVNWGPNVAARLGVDPEARLADLAPAPPDTSATSSTSCRAVAQPA